MINEYLNLIGQYVGVSNHQTLLALVTVGLLLVLILKGSK